MQIYSIKKVPVKIRFKQTMDINLPLFISIDDMCRTLDGSCDGSAFVIMHYSATGRKTELDSNFIRPQYLGEDDDSQIGAAQNARQNYVALQQFLDKEQGYASWEGCCRHNGYCKLVHNDDAALFIQCKDRGVIGIAWRDTNCNTDVGLRMCAFIAYYLGLINAKRDRTLWGIANNWLEKDASLIADVEFIKGVIFEGIRSTTEITGDFKIEGISQD